MRFFAAIAVVLAAVQSSIFAAEDIEQRYVMRWDVTPIIRLTIGRDLEINAVHCRINSEPFVGKTLSGRAVGVVNGRPTWRIDVSNVTPGTYKVIHDLRTPLGAEWIDGTVRIPQIARHTGSTATPKQLPSWPLDNYSPIAQDAGPVEFAWNRANLYIRPAEDSDSIKLTLDLLPSVPGKYRKIISVDGPVTIPWTELAPAGPHIGQALRYSVEGGEPVDLLFAGSGTNIHFGASPVGGPNGDDQGPPRPILDALRDMTGFDIRSVGIDWGEAEKKDPGDAPSEYDWSNLLRDPNNFKGGLVYAHIGLHNPWAEEIKTSDPVRYKMLAQRFVEAAARAYASIGIKTFSLGFNEPEMFFRSDREAHFVSDLNLTAEAVRRAVPDAQIIAGKFSSGAPGLIKSFYSFGFKDNFDVLDIHPYNNDPRTGTAMGEIVASHDTLAELGMGHKRIFLGEGWGPTRDLHQVPRAHHDAPVSPEEADCHRQFYQNGYRELITPRMDYSPDWVLGASYFTLNDNVGGTYWKQAARPVKNARGEVEYYLIGELRFDNPETLKAFFCNGGLVDFQGNPKGQWFFDFPPALPEVRVLASDPPKYVLTGEWHTLKVSVTNANPRPISDVTIGLRSQTGKFTGDISAEGIGSTTKARLAPGETWESAVKVCVNSAPRGPLRLALEVDYTYDGDVYMTDDVLRTEIRLPLDVRPEVSILDMKSGDPVAKVKVSVRNNERKPVRLSPVTARSRELELSAVPKTLSLKPEQEGSVTIGIKPLSLEPGMHVLPLFEGSSEALTVIAPTQCPRATTPPKIDGRTDDWPKEAMKAGSVRFGSAIGKAARPADYPFPEPPPVEDSAIGKTTESASANGPDAPVFGADAALMWDDDNLYLVTAVEDKTFVQNYTGMEVWRQDSLQIAIDPLDDGAGDRTASGADFAARISEEHYSVDDYEYALALTSDGPQVSRIVGPSGAAKGILPDIPLAVRHEDGFTYYEAAIPWSLLSPFKPDAGNRFRLDILVNNFEGSDRYTLGWSNAIADGKYPSRFVPVVLGK